MDRESILIFGVGPLQKSLIERCKLKGLYTVGIDPMEDAVCKNDVDAFEVVDGQDFEKTLEIAKRYNVKGVITTATDKPLVMMARVAERLNLTFFSVETAEWSTDKLLMKQKFMEADIPCAKGFLLNNLEELENHTLEYPVIVKPRDNSGSRGVIYCNTKDEVESAFKEAFQFTNKESVLIEEFIDGKEYSIEAIQYKGETHVIQITEKITTEFPYNVEIGHIQPADLPAEYQDKIKLLVADISQALKFESCASHTEVKINEKGVFVIESSPRLGGDFITSALVPLSTGINIEDLLIRVSLGESIDTLGRGVEKASGVFFFMFKEGRVSKIDTEFKNAINWEGVYSCDLNLKENDAVPPIKNSLSRYGQLIVFANNLIELDKRIKKYKCRIMDYLEISNL